MKRKKHSKSVRVRVNEAKGNLVEEENHNLFSYFDNLPNHLTTQIMLQLPVKSLLICKCVCKKWKTLISEPHFAKLHFEKAPISLMIRNKDSERVSRILSLLEVDSEKFEIGSNNHVKLEPMFKLPLRDAFSFRETRDERMNKSKRPFRATKFVSKKNENSDIYRQSLYIPSNSYNDRFNIVNSCNGLLCLSRPYNGNPLVICNPVSGEFIRLPEATTPTSRVNLQVVGSGLGFLPKTNEYKIVKIQGSVKWVFERVIVEINTLGTQSWRNIEVETQSWINIEVDSQITFSLLKCPTYVHGVLHWIRNLGQQRSILCFCLEKESLQLFPSPRVFGNHNTGISGYKFRSTMGELKGFLYLCDLSFDDITMWVMKEYGIEKSWTKVYNIDITAIALRRHVSWNYGYCWPIKQFEGVAISIYSASTNSSFIYYKREKCGPKLFRINGTRFVEVVPHIPSLISLKDIVKGDNNKVLNIYSRCAKYKLREEKEVLSLSEQIV